MPMIYLSPSTQEGNYYVTGGTEEQYMNLLADAMVPYLDAYFQSHNSITSAEFAKLFSLKRSTAHTRIKELVAQGVLRQTGHNKDTRYERGN